MTIHRLKRGFFARNAGVVSCAFVIAMAPGAPMSVGETGARGGCRDLKPSSQRLQVVGDSLVKLGDTTSVSLAAGDSIGVYAALDTNGTVVAHGKRAWRPDYSGNALTEVLPSMVGRQMPSSGIMMLYNGRSLPNGRHVVFQWGLLCNF